jgi:hypothetical protein
MHREMIFFPFRSLIKFRRGLSLITIKQFFSGTEEKDMEEKIERRKSFRLPFNAETVCHVNGKDFHGITRDLSVGCLFMETTERPPTSSKCNIEIVVPGDHSCLRIDKIKGVVMRHAEDGVAIQFDDLLEWVALIPILCIKSHERLTD